MPSSLHRLQAAGSTATGSNLTLGQRNFNDSAAVVGRLMLEAGELPVRELYRIWRKKIPRVREKGLETTLHLFFQSDLLSFQRYPDEDEPFVSLDLESVYFYLFHPLVCYAVEEILGDDAAQVLSVILARPSASAEQIVDELKAFKGFEGTEGEKVLLQLIRARVIAAWDPSLKLEDEGCRVDSDAVAKKQSWIKYVIKVNQPRLFVIYLLYLNQVRVECDPALGATGCEAFLGLCRASLLSTPRLDFLCDEWFQPVTAEEVFRHLPDSVKEGTDLGTVTHNLSGLVNHIDGFVSDSGNRSFTLKGSRLMGVWAEHMLYDILKAELPQVGLARAVMQYLIRNLKPYVQAKAIETELCGSTHALRYAVNELARLGFLDLMGTSHVAAFEPCRTELFLFVNLPRLYRQKIQHEQCKSLIRTGAAFKRVVLSEVDTAGRDNGKTKGSPTTESEKENADTITDQFLKMELVYLEAFLFSVMYVRSAGSITTELHSREAHTLVEFFGRKPIPDE